jgi:hypothetical protein
MISFRGSGPMRRIRACGDLENQGRLCSHQTGIRPSLTASATLTRILAVLLLQARRGKLFGQFQIVLVGTHMQALLPKLGWPETRRASCSGRLAAFLFRRCYSDPESCNFNGLHVISLARTRAGPMDCARHLLDSDEMIFVLARRKPRARPALVHDTAERYHAATTVWFDAVPVDHYQPAGPAGCGRVTPLQGKVRHYLASKSAEQREDKYGARQSI